MGFIAPPECLPIPWDQREQSSYCVPGDSSLGATHISPTAAPHLNSTSGCCPLLAPTPVLWWVTKAHTGMLPRTICVCTHCPYQGPWDAEDNTTWNPQPVAFGFWSEVFICWGSAVAVTLL